MKKSLTVLILLTLAVAAHAQNKKNERPEKTTNQKNVNVQKKNDGGRAADSSRGQHRDSSNRRSR